MSFFKKLFGISSEEKEEVKKQDVKLALDDLFVHNFVNKGGKFLYCLSEKELQENLKSVLLENNWNSLKLLDSDLNTFVDEKNTEIVNTSSKNIPVLTHCEYLISDSGDILFSSNQLKSKKLSEYSINFIVVAKTSQLVKNTSQGLTGIKMHSKGILPTNISAIKSYQTKNYDDSFLNYGNNNSKNLYLLLLEDL